MESSRPACKREAVYCEEAALSEVPAHIRKTAHRFPLRHVKCLADVQLTGFPVLSEPPVVIDTVGDIRVLLNLRDQDSLPDRMQRAGLNEEDVAFLYRRGVKHLLQCVVMDTALELLTADFASTTYHISVFPN